MRGEGYPSAEFIELCRSNISSFVDYPALRSRPLGGRSLRAAVSEDHAGICTSCTNVIHRVFLSEINCVKVVR